MPDEMCDDLHRSFEELRAEMRETFAQQTRTLLVAMLATVGANVVVQILISVYSS